MATECLLIDANDTTLKAKVEGLKPLSGLCIYVELTNATTKKRTGIAAWVTEVKNFLANSQSYMAPFKPLKGEGGCLSYFIEAEALLEHGHTPFTIYDGLWNLATSRGRDHIPVKIGAAWCENVYPLTFQQGGQERISIDIDITAQLASVAQSGEVIVEARLYRRVKEEHELDPQTRFSSVEGLHGPEVIKLNGITDNFEIYRGTSNKRSSE